MFSEFDWMKLMAGSPAMMALIAFSIITMGVGIERAIYYWRRRGNPDEIARNVAQHLRRGEIKEATWACEHANHPTGSILGVIVNAADEPVEEVDERIQVALSREKLLLERNLNVLGTMAGTAPLVGLLGTVWGIMRAFHDMAHVGSAAPSVVAAGIAEALVTTAIGLVVAVPSLILYNHFARRMSVMLTMAENHARTIRAWLCANNNTDKGAKTSNAAPEKTQHTTRKPEPVTVG